MSENKKILQPPVHIRAGGLPAHFPDKHWGNANTVLKKSTVLKYLKQKPKLIMEFIMESTDIDVLEEILHEKKKMDPPKMVAPIKIHPYILDTTKEVSKRIVAELSGKEFNGTLESVCQVLAHALKASDYSIHIQVPDTSQVQTLKNGILEISSLQGTVSGRALKKKKSIMLDTLVDNKRYPNGIGEGKSDDVSVLCVPIITPSEEKQFVFELIRTGQREYFNETDLHTAQAYGGWIAACLHENGRNKALHYQQYLIDFLLEITKELFEDMTSTDELVQQIMMFTKTLVSADRCSMFLVDEAEDELYADFFDEGAMSTTGLPIFKKIDQIRFPRDKGIAGHVAMTGEVVNIYDAYNDTRFNPEVDKMTGFKTRNILCMPIINRGQTQGVVQMINSTKSEYFTKADENSLRMFTGYCAFALHYSHVYNSLEKQQNQHKVALEMLTFHSMCPTAEAKALSDDPYITEDNIPLKFYTFQFIPSEKHDDKLPKLFIHMITQLFGRLKFDCQKLCHFVMTVRKNYRDVPYHNWYHGFSVAHALWRMIDIHPGVFTPFEQMGLLISGICHDIDHRGFNNDYFVKLQQPLANLYSTSVMEQHHYRQTVNIIQTEGQDIFSFMEPDAYKQMLEMIRTCIIATDLAQGIGVEKSLRELLDENTFRIKDASHRSKTISLMMTASDLSGISKPWETQTNSVAKLYEEFYEQGDEEKKRGIQPVPIMDRDNVSNIPEQQIDFIDFICKPFFTTLARILPKTKVLLDGCLKNRKMWQKRVNLQENTDEDGGIAPEGLMLALVK